jgi:signal transduction histidine kinase/CheY-like chemotaxis protein
LGATGAVAGRTFAEIIDASLAAGLFDLGDEPPEAFRVRCLGYHGNPVGTLELKTRDARNLRVTDRRTLEGGTISTAWDVTDDVAHEAELKAAREAAEAASSAKSEFLASMSHELRTPLNSILGFTQLLQRDRKTPLSERQQERLEHVLKGGEHLLRLIDDILDLSRIEAGNVVVSLEPVDLGEVLSGVKTTLDPMAARAGIGVAVLSNAVKYGKPGGKVTLAVVLLDDGYVRISVLDDGIGIPLEQQEKIFQPFHRAGQETGPIQGTGIGLAITKRLAELMQGRVGFESSPGEGSRFWIDLPLHETRADVGAAGVDRVGGPSSLTGGEGKRYSVVYIEDNPSNIAFMRELMEELERVDLITVPTAEVGIELVRDRRPHLVIMDINLPGMSGYEATRKLREWPETKDIPVVALTAAAMAGDRGRFEDAGFYRYLTKPVRVAELMETLEELLV